MGAGVTAVIPARYASTRFPGKPLALLAGKSEEDVFGIEEEQPKPELPAPPVPADRAEREAPRTIPRPGLAGGTAEARGHDPEPPKVL